MGGILRACGVEGFIGNAGALYDRLDIERAAWLDLVAAWYEAHGSNQVGTAELFNLASSPDDPKDGERGKDILAQFLGDKGERSRKTKLGNLLRERVDRVFGQYRIVAAGTYQGAAQYRLLPVNLSEHSEPCEPVPTPAYIQKEKISELTRDRIGSPGSQVHESSPNGKLSEYEEDVIL
jgi:hypothetical protein